MDLGVGVGVGVGVVVVVVVVVGVCKILMPAFILIHLFFFSQGAHYRLMHIYVPVCIHTGSALVDASEAISLEPSYIKGYYRRGTANLALAKLKQVSLGVRRRGGPLSVSSSYVYACTSYACMHACVLAYMHEYGYGYVYVC